MELTAEINKVFGEEMAKLVSSTYTEEELRDLGNRAMAQLTRCGNGYNSDKSELDKLVSKIFYERLGDQIKAILDTDEWKDRIQIAAVEVVERIKTETENKMVTDISDRLSGNMHGSASFRGAVEMIVQEALYRK